METLNMIETIYLSCMLYLEGNGLSEAVKDGVRIENMTDSVCVTAEGVSVVVTREDLGYSLSVRVYSNTAFGPVILTYYDKEAINNHIIYSLLSDIRGFCVGLGNIWEEQ